MKEMNEKDSLVFLVHRTDDVINMLNTRSSKARANSFYNAIVRFLPLAGETEDEQDTAYDK